MRVAPPRRSRVFSRFGAEGEIRDALKKRFKYSHLYFEKSPRLRETRHNMQPMRNHMSLFEGYGILSPFYLPLALSH